MTLYSALRPALFMLPPEKAHRAAIGALERGLVPAYRHHHEALKTTVAGLVLESPVGLAPGFDKNAECFEGALKAGCGFVEVGTITPRPQRGNPEPRVFRLSREQAIINRLGFNNEGMRAASQRLSARSGWGIIGGNIGKNKDTQDAIADYTFAMQTIYKDVDYITANISSPNTPGLRALQAADELKALIEALQELRAQLVKSGARHKPIFVKIAPDGEDALFEAIAVVARKTALDGLIISNTTLAREGVENSRYAEETGGLSGKPLFAPSTERLRQMYRITKGSIPLIGVGGISSAEDAYAKIRAGASLVQLYTALVYQGFGLIARINDGLAELLAKDGFAHVSEAVGVDANA